MTQPAYPLYSDVEKDWIIGLPLSATGVYRGTGTTINEWTAFLTVVDLYPGDYSWNGVDFPIGFADSANVTSLQVALYEAPGATDPSATAYTQVADTLTDITASQPPGTATTRVNVTFTTPVDVTIESGKSYAWAILGRKAASTANKPGIDTQDPAQNNQLTYRGIAGTAAAPGTTLPTLTAGDTLLGNIDVSTSNRTVLSTNLNYAGGTVFFSVPSPASGEVATIMFRDLVAVTAGWIKVELLTDDGAGALDVLGEFELNFVADEFRFGATGSINAVAVGAAEQAQNFDVAIQIHSGGTIGCLYVDVSSGQGESGTDTIWIHHTTKDTASRDRSGNPDPTIAAPTYLRLTNLDTAAIDTIEVGYEPLVMFGDSNAIDATGRWGNTLPDALTYEPILIEAAISGNKLTVTSAGVHTAGYLRFCHTTPALGDLCELRDVRFVFGGFGVNDIATIAASEAERDATTATILQRTAEILDNLYVAGNLVAIAGLPPYSDDGTTTEQEAQALRQLNAGLTGLAFATRTPYYDPWWSMVDHSTSGDAIPDFLTAYNNADDGIHYNAAGGAIVAAGLAGVIESGTVTQGAVILVDPVSLGSGRREV